MFFYPVLYPGVLGEGAGGGGPPVYLAPGGTPRGDPPGEGEPSALAVLLGEPPGGSGGSQRPAGSSRKVPERPQKLPEAPGGSPEAP